jgi:hypothetical protein
MTGLQRILDWLGSWGIQRRWPAGPPAPFPHGLTTCGDRRTWAKGGHFGASQVPGLTAAGPGAIDIDQLTAGGEGRAGAIGAGGLDVYFGSGQAAGSGALSRVG